MSKIFLFAVLLLCLAALGCGGAVPGVAPTPLPTTAPVPTVPSASPTAAAAKSGKLRYFENANLDVRDVPTLMAFDALRAQGYTIERQALASSSLLVDALTRGDADLITANTQTMWTAVGKGAKARTIVTRIGSTLVLEAKNEIKTCADLNGKPVGVAAATGTNPVLLNLHIEQHCAGAKPQFVVIADNAGRVAALISGQVDAALLQSEQLVQVEHDAPGKFYVLAPLYQEFSNVQINGLHVRQEWAQQNPQVVKDLLREVLLANRRVVAEPQVLYDEAAKRMKLSPADAKQVSDAYLQAGLWDPNGGMTQENAQYTLNLYQKNKLVPASLKLEDVADLSYLNAVLSEIGRK